MVKGAFKRAAGGKIFDDLEVEISQTGFGYVRVGPVKQVHVVGKILFESEMDQPNSRRPFIDGDKPLATA